MNWHVITVTRDDLAPILSEIRLLGGTVISTRPAGRAVDITYVASRDRESSRTA